MKYTQVTASLLVASATLASATHVNAKNVVNSDVQIKKVSSIESSATTAAFADAPLSTAVTTDANGATVTSYVWWEASTTATEESTSTAEKSSSAKETSKETSEGSSALSVTTAEFADAPLSTAVTTDANGVTVTSYVWWEASTTASEASSTGTSAESSTGTSTGSGESSTTGSATSRNWDEPLYTTTETLSNGEVTTQEIWWTPSVSSDTLAESTGSVSSTEVSTSSETYTTNGSTFTTQTLVTLAAKKDTNNTVSKSSTHYTVVNGTTEAVNGVAGKYQDSMYVALGAAVIGLLV